RGAPCIVGRPSRLLGGGPLTILSVLGFCSANRLPGADHDSERQRGCNGHRRTERQLVSPCQFLEAIEVAWWRAATGSLLRWRRMSIAKPLVVSYRRVRSFSRHFITIQSRSPRTRLISLGGSDWRCLATVVSSSFVSAVRRVEGRSGSFSRMMRRISSSPAFSNSLASNGVFPVNSS